MKILAVSDQIVETIYGSRIRERFGDVEMVLSCGDLPYSYLEYIISMLNAPCFFVHGNHDKPEYMANGRTLTRPGGWINLDGRTVKVKDIILGGLEGSMRYKPNAPFQYTDSEIAHKAWWLTPSLLMNRLFHGRYLDILIAHSPPFGIHDGEDWPHRGFKTFLRMMARFRPRYLLHGHKHIYGTEPWQTRYLDTEIINVHPFRVIEW
ncbi:MAG: metallophosphoesterase [Chloroflexi bacterium]|nr:MAG: metallophosphoesterase [Chloroflexota bacterium]RLC77325.1 MAG: metallophosphoesterase [Chloroflexota bacterium]HEY73798.1 metallophosphoesterase [Thermoflexia bacterium]